MAKKIFIDIPLIELMAFICLKKEIDSKPAKALKCTVKECLRKMFEPYLENRTSYAIERSIVVAKAYDMIKEEGDYLIANIIVSKSI